MIDANRIEAILKDCLFRDEEMPKGEEGEDRQMPDNFVRGEAIMNTFGFHPERLEKYRQEVKGILEQLRPQFLAEDEGGGGGWSFLNWCFDKDGIQWGEHPDGDRLIALGTALGYVSFPMPRDMWQFLPGSVPYIVVSLKEKANA